MGGSFAGSAAISDGVSLAIPRSACGGTGAATLILFEQLGADQPAYAGLVREDADNISPPFVRPLQRVRGNAAWCGAVPGTPCRPGRRARCRPSARRAWPARAELIGYVPPGLVRGAASGCRKAWRIAVARAPRCRTRGSTNWCRRWGCPASRRARFSSCARTLMNAPATHRGSDHPRERKWRSSSYCRRAAMAISCERWRCAANPAGG